MHVHKKKIVLQMHGKTAMAQTVTAFADILVEGMELATSEVLALRTALHDADVAKRRSKQAEGATLLPNTTQVLPQYSYTVS